MTTYTSVFGNETIPPSGFAYRAVALTADVTLGWPENTTGADTVAPIMNVTATGGTWTITLPAANEVSVGRDFIVRNVGATSFYVKDNAGGAIATVAAGEAKYVYLTSNSTVAGTWSVFTYGTGTSGADSAALAGYGLASISSTLNGSIDTTAVSVTRTIATTDRAQLLAYTGGTVTWYLPDHATMTNGFYTYVANVGTGTLTIDASTHSSTIDGSATKSVQPGESLILCCDEATGWYSVGYGRSNTFVYTQLVVDVSAGGTADMTITSTQAQNKLWYFYNTASGSRNVVIPAVASVYFVRVGAIGAGHTLTFTTGSGSAVSIAANLAYTIYCDGTNVVNATSSTAATSVSMDDGSSSSPSVYFTLDTNTGIYRAGSDTFGIAAGGAMAATFGTSGPSFVQPVSVSNGGTGATTVGAARTALGATTVGGNLFTLTNPSAITFPQLNADNTVSALSASAFRTAIGASSSTGDVVGPASSVDSEIVLFDSTTGKLIKRASTTGMVKATSGVISAATAGTDFVKPDTATTYTATQTFKGVRETRNEIGRAHV